MTNLISYFESKGLSRKRGKEKYLLINDVGDIYYYFFGSGDKMSQQV